MKNQAVRFEEVSKSRTYLLFNEDCLFVGKNILIGYFTLALKVLKIGDLNLSNRKIKEFDGISAKMRGDKITELPVYLIGQLSKNDQYSKSYTGKELIHSALAEILKSQQVAGGRLVLVESKDNQNLIKFYEHNDFELIRQDTDNLLQFVRVIG